MQISPYLFFNGQCEEALKFYEHSLGGKIEMMMTNGSSPMAEQLPAESHNKIMHASLRIGNSVLMAADSRDGHYEQPKGFSVTLGIQGTAEAERIFHALAENGTVQMQLQETFWTSRFGMLVDRFGIPWTINCEEAA
jgi:PhnB protein